MLPERKVLLSVAGTEEERRESRIGECGESNYRPIALFWATAAEDIFEKEEKEPGFQAGVSLVNFSVLLE